MNPLDSPPQSSVTIGDAVTCPLCGTVEISTILHQDSFKYGSGDSAVTLQVNLPVRRCASCDIEFIDDEGERIRHDAVCRHLGVLTPDEIRGIRKTHGMTRAAFAQVTGIGVATLNRWENGTVVQSLANDRYLRILSTPGTINTLKTLLRPRHNVYDEPTEGDISRFVRLELSERHRQDQKSFQLRLAG